MATRDITDSLRTALLHLLMEIGKGHAVTILSSDAELTPQQAADLIQVSRPHFMRAIQQSAIPYRKVGAHYRVRLQDVLAYQTERDRRRQILKELIAESQELNLGY